MTYKIETRAAAEGPRLEVHGLIDAAVVDAIREVIAATRTRRVVLKIGCQVDFGGLSELRRLAGVDLVAESPFLARCLTTG